MTFRAVVLGFVGALMIAGFGYLNDSTLQLNFLAGHHFPVIVFGVLLVVAMAVNPLLFALKKSWRLRPGELAIGALLMMVACSLSGSGMLRTLTQATGMPIHLNKRYTGWQSKKVISYTPPSLMPAGGEYDDEIIGNFVSGMGEHEKISLWDIPWHGWTDFLASWMPIIILMNIAVICLALMVHRQWAHRERLRYPVIEFAGAITAQQPDSMYGTIFRNRLFWGGLIVVMVIRGVNGIYAWNTGFIKIPLMWDWYEHVMVASRWTALNKAYCSYDLFRPSIIPLAVGIGYLLASDVSLSLGISQVFFVFMGAIFIENGVDFNSNWSTGGPSSWMIFGSYFGMTLLLIYTGRRYYADLLRQAFTFRRREGVEPYAAWACRLFLLACVGLVCVLCGVGLSWPVAIITVLLMMMGFLVMSRIIAETGLFYIMPFWQPTGIVVALFGAAAIGPQSLIIVGLLSVVLTISCREALMPYVINGLKFCDDHKIKPASAGWSAATVFLVGLCVAIPVLLWANYNYGSPGQDEWATLNAPRLTYDMATREITKLQISGDLDASISYTGLERLKNMNVNEDFLIFAGAGLVLVLMLSICRMRFPWWPLHPILVLVWGTWPLRAYSHSFLIGWFLKTVLIQLGGAKVYGKAKPFMIGMIAGELMTALIFMAHGAIYHLVTGLIPVYHQISFPWKLDRLP